MRRNSKLPASRRAANAACSSLLRAAVLTVLVALAASTVTAVLCGCGGVKAGSVQANSDVRAGQTESGRYWHVTLTIDTVSQELWYDTQKGLIVRVRDDMNDFANPKGVAGYQVTKGDFTQTTRVTYEDRPPYVTYRFTTDAFCTVEIAGSTDRGTWGIVSKSDQYPGN